MASGLAGNIRDGTFPESNEVLGQDANVEGISSLLANLAESREQLRKEIGDISQSVAGDVDEWISQAKKVQDDIARCKIEARNIVEEHKRVETLRDTSKNATNKVQFLETEIAFTKALEHEIESVSRITQIFGEVGSDLSSNNVVEAVGKLIALRTSIESISASRTRSLLSNLEVELRQNCQQKLEQLLNMRWIGKVGDADCVLIAHANENDEAHSGTGASSTSTDGILRALDELQALPSAVALILRILEATIVAPISSSSPYPAGAEIEGDRLTITRKQSDKDSSVMLSALRTIFQFLYEKLPKLIIDDVARQLVPKVMAVLIQNWLDPALPHDLHDLQNIEPVRSGVSNLAKQLQGYSWPGEGALKDWEEEIPRSWLAKRRMASLGAVRKAFLSARGTLRSVERVERQRVDLVEAKESHNGHEVDWNADWDGAFQKEVPSNKEPPAEDYEASGWDFETEDEDKSHTDKNKDPSKVVLDEDDADDAWGWGDDDVVKDEPEKSISVSQPQKHQANGEKLSPIKSQEMVLTESYHITDIPDCILEIIGKDMADSHELQRPGIKYFDSASPATGLAGLPNLILALFRATAPTYYSLVSTNHNLSNINLYNDTLYIVQKLTESPDSSTFQPSIQALTKFARQVYSSELDVQRTVLADLLDGAQGFERCTTFPNSQACIDAVSSTIDRVRQLHKEWSSILGESHLLQSLGSLMTMIFGKVTKDVEDMDDISEAESKQLVSFCQQILGLEDLFSSRLPNLTQGQPSQQEPQGSASSQILLYVPNYLRFQYLQQILDSSLVDIKYLWTEGELSLEFSAEEVVDLINALFAESQHRRNAIRTIRGSAVG